MPEARATIVHISDLHFGWTTLDHEVLTTLKQLIGTIRPQFLVVSGDVANNPTLGAMRKASKCIYDLADQCDISREHVVVIPGNHDYKILGNFGLRRLTRVPFETYFRRSRPDDSFAKRLATVSKLTGNALWPWGTAMGDDEFNPQDICYSAEHGVVIVPFNSTPLRQKFGLATGKVDEKQIRGAAAYIAKEWSGPNSPLKIAVVHHHPIPIAYVSTNLKSRIQESFMVFFNAGTFLRELGRSGVDVVLHGHKHYAGFSRVTYDLPDTGRREMSVLAAGSASHKSRGDPLGNQLNVIRVYDDDTVDAEQIYFSAAVIRKDESRRYLLHTNDDVRERKNEILQRTTGMTCGAVFKKFTLTEHGYSAVVTTLMRCASVTPSGVKDYVVDLTAPDPSYLRDYEVAELPRNPGSVRFEEDSSVSHFRHKQGRIVFGETRMIKDGPFDIGWTYRLLNGHALDAAEFHRKYLGRQKMEWEYATLWCEEPTQSLTLTVEFPFDIHTNIEKHFVQVVYEPWAARQGSSRILGDDECRHDEETSRLKDGINEVGSRVLELTVPAPIPGLGYRICWRYPDKKSSTVGRRYEEQLKFVRRSLIEAAEKSVDDQSPFYQLVRQLLVSVLEDAVRDYPVGDPEEKLSISLAVLDDRPERSLLRFVASNRDSIADLLDETLVPGEGCAGFSFEKRKTLFYDRELDRTGIGYYVSPEEMAQERGGSTALLPHTVLITVPWVADDGVPVGVLSIGSICEFSRLLRVFDLDEDGQKAEMKRLLDLTETFGDAVVQALSILVEKEQKKEV